MDRGTEFGEFLRARRARLRPEDAGITGYGGRRRVPGLRREELAQLAGLSVDYYVRLEQGRRGHHASAAVLDAIARALRLDDDERTHLHRLARPTRSPRRAGPRQQVRPQLRALLDAITDAAAYIVGRRTDVLAQNRLGAALIADFDRLPARQRNFARYFFTDEPAQALFADWPAKARDLAGYLRIDAGRHPDDPAMAELVGELSLRSDLFRRLWADHPVRGKTHATAALNHPVVGRLDLAYEALRIPDDPDQLLITYSAPPDSEAAHSLRLLASWHADHGQPTHDLSRQPTPHSSPANR